MNFLKIIFDISPFEWQAILSALVAGGIIGLERQLSGKPIGIRTGMLICISTCLFASFAQINTDTDTESWRIIGQIITGIGFLGAGVILTRDGIVIGITSAACIWMLAAIGITIGTGHTFTGIKLSLITVLLLTSIEKAEKKIKFLNRGMHKKNKNRLKPDEGL